MEKGYLMKKKLLIGVTLIMSVSITFMGCKNNMLDYRKDADDVTINYNKSTVSKNIEKMKTSGLLNNLLSQMESRSAANSLNDDDVQLMRFINETDDVLAEIAESENGIKEINLITCLFSGSSVEDVRLAFSDLSQEMADEFQSNINSLVEHSLLINDTETARSGSVSCTPVKLLYYMDSSMNNARGAYSDDMNNDTIAWYTGFCAATIAGCIAASYGGFWTRIAGTVAAAAGITSMTIQLTKWCCCTDLAKLVGAIAGQDAYTANAILQSDLGKRYLLILSETTCTVIACYVTPFGRLCINTVVDKINILISAILDILPAGVNYTICNVPIKIITL